MKLKLDHGGARYKLPSSMNGGKLVQNWAVIQIPSDGTCERRCVPVTGIDPLCCHS